MPLPAKIRTDTVFDKIHSIRLLWLQGKCDAEVKRILGIDADEFRQLKELTRTTRVNRQSALEAYADYVEEHEKFVARQEVTLAALAKLMAVATARHPLGDEPKDVRAARKTAGDIRMITESILQSQSLLLSIKTKLGLVEIGHTDDDNDVADESMLFKRTTIREAWKIREARDVTGNGNRPKDGKNERA